MLKIRKYYLGFCKIEAASNLKAFEGCFLRIQRSLNEISVFGSGINIERSEVSHIVTIIIPYNVLENEHTRIHDKNKGNNSHYWDLKEFSSNRAFTLKTRFNLSNLMHAKDVVSFSSLWLQFQICWQRCMTSFTNDVVSVMSFNILGMMYEIRTIDGILSTCTCSNLHNNHAITCKYLYMVNRISEIPFKRRIVSSTLLSQQQQKEIHIK
ncbi:hypothetical protein BDA99DRAFT_533891 [Phascolomyces articulosus]|uniref:SWIM-type domain-containing protein n=1 Tax=Phascolomyces articulosus TaxID=60185 RepID=A0AAD5K815_9FUNG|nr:hypothetical protein BDA99DRAFT_533891 [Phascolomyces articulosus]